MNVSDTGSKVTAPCYGAWIDMINTQQTAVQTKNADGTATDTPTVLTRAFSGRLARGLANRFHADHGAVAPAAYPEIHHLTSPLRAHGRRSGDAEVINLWAGEAHRLATEGAAEDITRRLAEEAQQAIADAAGRWV